MSIYSLKRLYLKYKIFLLPFVVLIIMVFLIILFVKPKLDEIDKLNRQISKDDTALAKLSKKANELVSIDPTEIKDKFNVLSSAIPSDKDIPGFMLGVSRIANEASVSVGLIEVSPGSLSTASAGKNMKEIPVVAKVVIKGKWQHIVDFITKAINSRRLLKIEGVDLSGATAQKVSSDIQMSILITIYSQPLPKTLGSIEEPLSLFSEEEDILYSKISRFPLYSGIERQAAEIQSGNESVETGTVPVGKTDLFNR